MKLVLAALLICSIVLTCSFLEATMAQPSTAPPGVQTSCGKNCGIRCINAKNNAGCLKDCGTCCNECPGSCVPSGTSGNRDDCPCYRDKRNSKGQPKCP